MIASARGLAQVATAKGAGIDDDNWTKLSGL